MKRMYSSSKKVTKEKGEKLTIRKRNRKDIQEAHGHIAHLRNPVQDNQQEAHGPHRSPEKTVQINKHI